MHRDCAENLPLRLADFPADKSPVCIEVDHLCSVKGDGRSMQLHASRREDMAQFAHRWHIQRATQLQIPHLVWLDFVLPKSKASYQRQVSSRAWLPRAAWAQNQPLRGSKCAQLSRWRSLPGAGCGHRRCRIPRPCCLASIHRSEGIPRSQRGWREIPPRRWSHPAQRRALPDLLRRSGGYLVTRPDRAASQDRCAILPTR